MAFSALGQACSATPALRPVRMLMDDRMTVLPLLGPHARERRAAARTWRFAGPCGCGLLLGLDHQAVEIARRLPKALTSVRGRRLWPSSREERRCGPQVASRTQRSRTSRAAPASAASMRAACSSLSTCEATRGSGCGGSDQPARSAASTSAREARAIFKHQLLIRARDGQTVP